MENLKYFMEHLLPIFFVLCFIALSLLLVIFIGALCVFIYDWLDDTLYDLRVWVKSLKSRKP